MYTVKNTKPTLTVIVEGGEKTKNKLVKIYYDNLAIEIVTDKLNGGY